MKKLLLLSLLISNLTIAQAVKNRNTNKAYVNLNEILRMSIENKYNETNIAVFSSCGKWEIKCGSNDSSKVEFKMLNLGSKIPQANFNTACALCNYPTTIIVNKIGESNAGDMSDNNYRIIWEPSLILTKPIEVTMELNSLN